MADTPAQEWRRQRLEALVRDHFDSNKALAGRSLGLGASQPGAYVRQLLAGERPITEKTISKIETAQHGRYRGWFAHAQTIPLPATLNDIEREMLADVRELVPRDLDAVRRILREYADRARDYRAQLSAREERRPYDLPEPTALPPPRRRRSES